SDALIAALLNSPHPDPPDDALGLGLMIAVAIAEAHGGSLQGRAGAGDTVELVLELPAGRTTPVAAAAQDWDCGGTPAFRDWTAGLSAACARTAPASARRGCSRARPRSG